MDSGYRSPLVDMFRRGEADRSSRLTGAQGALGLRAHEQVALLMLLAADQDLEISYQAEVTIAALPAAAVSEFLARPDVPDVVRTFFAARGVLPAAAPAEAQPLAAETSLDAVAEEPETERESPQVLASLPVVERLKLATKGSREQRAQLIRDSNRLVATAVLSSPKVNDSEIEVFAKMTSVSEDILRIIGVNRTWLKNYGVALGLARNPKTPPGLSMQLLHRLTERDVKAVATDRNVPETLRIAARRLVSKTQK